jgi:hypothetical protein
VRSRRFEPVWKLLRVALPTGVDPGWVWRRELGQRDRPGRDRRRCRCGGTVKQSARQIATERPPPHRVLRGRTNDARRQTHPGSTPVGKATLSSFQTGSKRRDLTAQGSDLGLLRTRLLDRWFR